MRIRRPSLKLVEQGRPICCAPFASLHLDPQGDVRACCQNTWQRLGNVGEQSLLEIWRGEPIERLRQRLAEGDLGLGCEMCAVEIDIGTPERAFLEQFEPLRAVTTAAAGWPRQLELALSIACNLQCVMCNGDLSSAIRIHREGRQALPRVYGEEFFAELDLFLPHLERVTFLGGEPFLGPEPLRVMERLIEMRLRPRCHVNTNGTQYNERIVRILHHLPMHVAISVDGASQATIEAIRAGVDYATLIDNVDRFRNETLRTGNGMSLTFCLMPQNWHELGEVLAWGDRLDVDVFVNTVTHPPGMSLHHSPHEELESVAVSMERLDRRLSQTLVRNQPVWKTELARIQSLLATRTAAPSVPSAVDARGLARNIVESGWRRGTAVHEVTVDRSQVITSIYPEGGQMLGLATDQLIGRSSVALLESLLPSLGDIKRSEVEFHENGVEERRFWFDGPHPKTFRAAMARTDFGEVWYVAVGVL